MPCSARSSDLAVANSNELVAFSPRLRPLAARRVRPGVSLWLRSQPAVVGYDETGRYLPTMDLETGRVTVRDVANGSALAELAQDEWPEWLGDGALVVFRGETEADLLDLDTGERRIPVDSELVGPSERMYPSRRGDGRAWAVIEGTGPYGKAAVEVDVHTGAVTSGPVPLPGTPYNLAPGPEPDTLWLNYQETDRGDHLSWDNGTQAWLALVDSNSGEVLREVDSVTVSAVGPQGEVVGSDYWGDISEFDPVAMDQVARLAGARGATETLGFSDERGRLVATGDDGTVQVYETDGWARVGIIPSHAPQDLTEGFLRPDGLAVAVNGEYGVVEWTLDPATLAEGGMRSCWSQHDPHRVGDLHARRVLSGHLPGVLGLSTDVLNQIVVWRVLHERAVAPEQLLAHGVAGAAVDQEAPDLVAPPDPSARPARTPRHAPRPCRSARPAGRRGARRAGASRRPRCAPGRSRRCRCGRRGRRSSRRSSTRRPRAARGSCRGTGRSCARTARPR